MPGLLKFPVLSLHLIVDRHFDIAKTVHVFQFDDWCGGRAAVVVLNVKIDVGVAAQRAFLHIAVRNSKETAAVFSFPPDIDVLRTLTEDPFADDLQQWRARAIKIDTTVSASSTLIVHILACVSSR